MRGCPPRPARRGLTLIELCITLVVLTLLGTMAVPGFSDWLARHRLRNVAQELAADLGEARLESARLGQPVHVSFRTGDDWCYALALEAGLDCRHPGAKLLKVVRSPGHPGVTLVEAAPQAFDGRHGASLGATGFARFENLRGERLTVRLSGVGRPSVCSPDGALRDVGRC